MPPSAIWRSLPVALIISAFGVGLAVFVQVPLLYRHGLTASIPPRPPAIQRITFASDGEQTLLLAKRTVQTQKLYAELAILRGEDSLASPKTLRAKFAPWLSTSAVQNRLGFVAATNGELYSVDLRQPDPDPRLIGKHHAAYSSLLECSTNGSLLVVGDSATMSGWDTKTGVCLWRRNEQATIAADFLPDSERFFYCRYDGQLLELNARTDAVRQHWNSHCIGARCLVFAKTEQRFAAVDLNYRCVVSELGREAPSWAVQLHVRLAAPRFSPDGKFILIASPTDQSRVVIHSADSGELTGELVGGQGMFIGLAVSPTGIVYAWNDAGTVTVWNLETRALLHQFTPFG